MLALTFCGISSLYHIYQRKYLAKMWHGNINIPYKKFNTYVTKVDTYYSSAYVTATVGDFKKSDNWTVRTK